MKIKIGFVEDKQQWLDVVITHFIWPEDDIEVTVTANNGQELLDKLEKDPSIIPEVLFIDIMMPVMDGVKTVNHVSKKYPDIKLVALSHMDTDGIIIRMIRAGCCAYLLKSFTKVKLLETVREVYTTGIYNDDEYNRNIRKLKEFEKRELNVEFSEREMEFLELSCTELTYAEISKRMNFSYSTSKKYQSTLFKRLGVQTRSGLVIEVLRKNLVNLEGINAFTEREIDTSAYDAYKNEMRHTK